MVIEFAGLGLEPARVLCGLSVSCRSVGRVGSKGCEKGCDFFGSVTLQWHKADPKVSPCSTTQLKSRKNALTVKRAAYRYR